MEKRITIKESKKEGKNYTKNLIGLQKSDKKGKESQKEDISLQNHSNSFQQEQESEEDALEKLREENRLLKEHKDIYDSLLQEIDIIEKKCEEIEKQKENDESKIQRNLSSMQGFENTNHEKLRSPSFYQKENEINILDKTLQEKINYNENLKTEISSYKSIFEKKNNDIINLNNEISNYLESNKLLEEKKVKLREEIDSANEKIKEIGRAHV